MRQSVRWGLGVLLMLPPASALRAQAPDPAGAQPRPAAGSTAPAARPAAPARDPRADEVLATVGGEKITRGEVLGFLSRLEAQPGREKAMYKYAIETLSNTKLLNQFLAANKVAVDPKEVDAEVERTAQEIRGKQGTDLATALAENNVSIPELRSQITQYLRWKKYLLSRATDAELAKFIERNKDDFAKTQVRASHILVMVDPDAPAAEKAKAQQRLLEIKKEIESGKITFSDAANKYSEDEGNKANQNGGDLGYFPRKGQYVESFSAAAFGLKPNVVSDPVESDYGYHLILVTNRKEGTPVDPKKLLAQYKEQILSQYAFELQSQIVADQRKAAKIDVKPQPPDILPPTPAVVPAPAAAAPR